MTIFVTMTDMLVTVLDLCTHLESFCRLQCNFICVDCLNCKSRLRGAQINMKYEMIQSIQFSANSNPYCTQSIQ